MGDRTVVVLNNDLAHEWENDPLLGKKISRHVSLKFGERPGDRFQYGDLIEKEHANCQTVAFIDGYRGKAMAYSHWFRGQTEEQRNIQMLKALADKLGYRVSKKPTKDI